MCISAPTSFIAGTILTVAGLGILRLVKKREQYLFAAIPLIFAIQQFSEGFVWLSLIKQQYFGIRKPASLTFLFFAQFVWPTLVPLSVYFLEKNLFRKKILLVLSSVGIMFSCLLLRFLYIYTLDVFVIEHHIHYQVQSPTILKYFLSFSYFASTVASLFIGSQPRLKSLGVVILTSFILSAIFFEDTLISIWCFLAAIASVMIYYVLFGMPDHNLEKVDPINA